MASVQTNEFKCVCRDKKLVSFTHLVPVCPGSKSGINALQVSGFGSSAKPLQPGFLCSEAQNDLRARLDVVKVYMKPQKHSSYRKCI